MLIRTIFTRAAEVPPTLMMVYAKIYIIPRNQISHSHSISRQNNINTRFVGANNDDQSYLNWSEYMNQREAVMLF